MTDSNSVEYVEGHKSSTVVDEFSKTKEIAFRYLEFRDIPRLITEHFAASPLPLRRVLDYGVGAGFSLQFLHDKVPGDHQLVGVDIDPGMLDAARKACPFAGELLLVEGGVLPFADDSFDAILSSLVLFEMPSRGLILSYLREARRVLRPGGLMVAATASEHMYSASRGWASIDVDFPENAAPRSGDPVKCRPTDAVNSVIFVDYYWTHQDLQELFGEAGLFISNLHFPLGVEGEPFHWEGELSSSPLIIISASKKNEIDMN